MSFENGRNLKRSADQATFSMRDLSPDDIRPHLDLVPPNQLRQLFLFKKIFPSPVEPEISFVFSKEIKVRKKDGIAQKRKPKVKVGHINIRIAEIKNHLGLSETEDSFHIALSYLLHLQERVNSGEIANTPEALLGDLRSMREIQIYFGPEFSPEAVNLGSESSRFSLSFQISVMNKLIRLFKDIEPDVSYAQITFSEIGKLYTLWLQLITQKELDDSEEDNDIFKMLRGTILHKIDSFFDALRIADQPNPPEVFPTHSDYAEEFRAILDPYKNILILKPHYYDIHQDIINFVIAQQFQNADLETHAILTRRCKEIRESCELLSTHWLTQQEENCHLRVIREHDVLMLMWANYHSLYPLGLSIYLRFDGYSLPQPSGFNNTLGQRSSVSMFDLKTGGHKDNGDTLATEVKLKETQILFYLFQSFIQSYHFNSGQLVPLQTTDADDEKEELYITKVPTFLTRLQEIKAHYRQFNPDAKTVENIIQEVPIELSQQDLLYLNVWFARVFTPWVHIFKAVKGDISILQREISQVLN